MKNLKRELMREMKMWMWYAAISTLAGLIGYAAVVDRYYELSRVGSDFDVNPIVMLLKPVWTYLIPFICVFSVLSAIRIGIICLFRKDAR